MFIISDRFLPKCGDAARRTGGDCRSQSPDRRAMRRSQTLGWEKRRDAPTRNLRVRDMSPAPDSRGRTDGGRQTPAHFIANRSGFDLGRNASWPPNNALGNTSRKAHRRASVARRACILHLNLKDFRHAACPANGRLPLSVGASRAPKRVRCPRSPTLAGAGPPPTHTGLPPDIHRPPPRRFAPISIDRFGPEKSRAKGASTLLPWISRNAPAKLCVGRPTN